MFPSNCRSFGSGRLTLALLATILAPELAFATIPWTTAVDAAGGNIVPSEIKVLPTNEFCVTGLFSGGANFAGTKLVSSGGADVFLAKYAQPGQLEWVVRAGSVQDDRAEAIAVDDASGSLYVTGQFIDSATFGSTDNTTTTVAGSGQTIFLAKYTPSGVLVWVQTGVMFGGNAFGAGVAVDATRGTVYLTALAQGPAVFSSQNGPAITVDGVWTWHMALVKYDVAGHFRWAEVNSAAPNSIPHGVALDKYGNPYVTGWMEGSTVFYSRDGKNVTVTGFSDPQSNPDYPGDAFLVKYDQYGNVRWANHVGGYKAIANVVQVDPYGEVTIAGFIGNSPNGPAYQQRTIVTSQPGAANINLGGGYLTDPYNTDEFFATWNGAGQLKRAARTGGLSNEASTGLAYSLYGGVNTLGVRIANGTTTMMWHKYWKAQLLWNKTVTVRVPWAPEAHTPAAAVDGNGNLIIVGAFQGTASFGAYQLTSTGTSDMYIAELPPN